MFTMLSSRPRSRRWRSSLAVGAVAVASLTGASAAQAALPTITNPNAIVLSQTAANLAATVNLQGLPGTIRVQYGTTTSYGTLKSEAYSGSGNYTTWFEASSLSPGTVYHYKFSVTTSAGTTYDSDRVFVTPATPTIISSDAIKISATHENLASTINTFGKSGTIRVDYGTTTSFGTNQTESYTTSSDTPGTYATWFELYGLTTGVTYYYKFTVTTSEGSVQTGIKSFVAGV